MRRDVPTAVGAALALVLVGVTMCNRKPQPVSRTPPATFGKPPSPPPAEAAAPSIPMPSTDPGTGGGAPAESKPAVAPPPAPKTRSLEGTVLRPDGVTPAFTRVRISGPRRPGQDAALRDDWTVDTSPVDGGFRLDGLPAGTLSVTAQPIDPKLGGQVTVEATEETANLRITLRERTFLRFLLLDAATEEWVDTRAELHRIEGNEESVLSTCRWGFGPEGIEENVTPGVTNRFRAIAEGYLPSEPVEATLRLDQTSAEVCISLGRNPLAPKLTLEVADETGTPPDSISVWKIDRETRNEMGWRLRPEGGRVVLPILEGTCLIGVGGGELDDSLEEPWLWTEFEVTAVRGQNVVRRVRLVKGGFLRLHPSAALLAADRSLGNEAVLRSGEARLRRFIGNWPDGGKEDDEGPAEFRPVVRGTIPAGTWTLEFPKSKARPVTVQVRPGEITEVTVEEAVEPAPLPR